MNNHDLIRKQLAAAAAGLLEDVELRGVHEHAQSCESCRRDLDYWLAMTKGLGEMPQPSLPIGLVERTNARLLSELERSNARSGMGWLLGGLTIWGWGASAATLYVAQSLIGKSPLLWLGGWATLVLVTATASAVVLANRASTLRRNYESIS